MLSPRCCSGSPGPETLAPYDYGWPIITYGRNYDGSVLTEQNAHEGMEQPRFYWVPSIGITNLLFYAGDRFPMWRGQLPAN